MQRLSLSDGLTVQQLHEDIYGSALIGTFFYPYPLEVCPESCRSIEFRVPKHRPDYSFHSSV